MTQISSNRLGNFNRNYARDFIWRPRLDSEHIGCLPHIIQVLEKWIYFKVYDGTVN